MRKVIIWALTCVLFLFSISCINETAAVLEQDDLSDLKQELDEYILNQIKASNTPFNWDLESDEILFKGLNFTDNILVVGYDRSESGNNSNRNELLKIIYESERIEPVELGAEDDVLIVKNDILGFLYVKVEKWETLKRIRNFDKITYVELSGYPLTIEKIMEFIGDIEIPNITDKQESSRMNMVLDPALTNPDYPTQVSNFSGGAGACIRRHNVDQVYLEHGIFGEGIGVAVLDNGLLPGDYDFLTSNGYGRREARGYYNPLWFFPWTEADGTTPQQPDVLFISQFVEGQWLHGLAQNQQVLMIAPNSTQYSVRASPLVLVLAPSQILGIINSILELSEDDDIKIISMSMGSLWYINHMDAAINHFNSQDKIMVSAAGTSVFIIRSLLGIIFPATESNTLAATGIENREETEGNFVLGSSSHFGPELDYCTENNQSSSEATSRLAAMIALVWSANPDLNREEILDILIQSSHFYNELGAKHFKFGWGTIDVLQAVELAMEL